jgi:phosphatidylethanolamine-binding protein (PEBP) family uncharacterized protein
MRRPLGATSSTASIASAALLLAIMSAGCGSGSSTGSAKKQAVIPLTSVAIKSGAIPARYTCDGADISPPLKWSGVPVGTNEVVLVALGLTPSHAVSSVEWAIAGVKPGLDGLKAGEMPPGAFLEEASDGQRRYSICPPKGQAQLYEFVLYAVPPLIRVAGHINGVNLFHNLAEGSPQDRAPARGAFSVTYRRR